MAVISAFMLLTRQEEGYWVYKKFCSNTTRSSPSGDSASQPIWDQRWGKWAGRTRQKVVSVVQLQLEKCRLSKDG